MNSPRVTLADIARRAGVSRTAVSYALRDDPNVGAETRTRIRRAAELGYETEEFWLHEPGRSPRRLAQMLVARGIHGLVIGSTGRHGSVVEFPWAKFAAVTVGYSVASPALHRVVTHHYRNTRLALRKVAEHGVRRVGLVVSRTGEALMEDLHLAAFLAYQQDLPADLRVPPLRWETRNARELAAWFRAHRPEAVLTTELGVAAFAEAGLRVPKDIRLVKLLRWTEDKAEAGVLPGYERLGGAAIDLLVGPLHRDEFGVPPDARIVQVEGRWSDGASLPVRSSVSGA